MKGNHGPKISPSTIRNPLVCDLSLKANMILERWEGTLLSGSVLGKQSD